MTSLSTLFGLGCIITFIQARKYWLYNYFSWRVVSLFFVSFICLLLALFSKENATLIPLIILLVELVLFSKKKPWSLINNLSKQQKLTGFFIIATLSITALLWAIDYAAGGFNSRPFTMMERLLTESRVLVFYISLILIPRINGFGLFHDDIAISTSLLSPWTTIPSIIFIFGLLIVAFYYRKKNPLFALGIGWFFIGHLLESTFFPLEIAHEHRNNFPSIGIILATASFTPQLIPNTRKLISCILLICLMFGSITWIRSNQWRDTFNQAFYETIHHPNSAAAQSILANAAHKTGHIQVAMESVEKAMQLTPKEIAYPIYLQHILATTGQPIPNSLQIATLQRIEKFRITPSAELALSQISDCLQYDSCSPLRENYIEWIDAVIKTKPNMPYFYLLKGKALVAQGKDIEALNIFQQGFDMDQKFLHPLFEMIDIFMNKREANNARLVISWLKEANEKASIPRDKELKLLEQKLALLEKAITAKKKDVEGQEGNLLGF